MLIGRFQQPLVAFVALVAILHRDSEHQRRRQRRLAFKRFLNLNPRLISFRTGGIITGVVGVLMMPWKLLGDYSSYIYRVAGRLLRPSRARSPES